MERGGRRGKQTASPHMPACKEKKFPIGVLGKEGINKKDSKKDFWG